MSKTDKLLQKEDHIYVLDHKYILVFLDVCYVILITDCSNYL